MSKLETLDEFVNSESLATKVMKHFNVMDDTISEVTEGKNVDIWIKERAVAEKETNNMLGFGIKHSQRIIIDFDKEYEYCIAIILHTISSFFCTRLWQEPVKEIVAQKYPIEKLLE